MLQSEKSTELQVPTMVSCDDERDTDITCAEVETIMGTSSKENQNVNPASSTVKKKTVKRRRQTRISACNKRCKTQSMFL